MKKRSIVLICLLILLDQLTKYIISSAFLVGSSIEILPFFRLTYVTNTGIAFSLFQGSNIFFLIFTVVILSLLVSWYLKNIENISKTVNLSLLLIFSGAIGNLIDRLFRGYVVDFLDFYIGTYHWPAFNLADSCITIGGIILLISALSSKEKNKIKEI
ncbi:MAG: signal peptidase II [Elusimicrobia bacterium]|nr:signal peptidase II [Elusimicrobiota bacterium]